jgi:phosphomannomutase
VQDDVTELLARAREWHAEDPDPETREELAKLIEVEDRAELASRFAGTLQFGTAGLRGELGAGPMRMNRSVVIRAAAGLAAYLRDESAGSRESGESAESAGSQQRAQATGEGAAGERPGLVVIGYDARHKSHDFARDTASVMTGAGLRAVLLPRPLPTPVLAYAVRHLRAAAGVMVTASHNPPRDNGYKVYLGGGGSQIVPPADAAIAARIDAVGPLADVPLPASGWDVLGEDIVESYLARTGAVLTEGMPRNVRIVHTALHGVGSDTVLAAFRRAGFPEPVAVRRQAVPDPDFPTVSFPNPEEPGAMDLAFATARETAAATGPVDLVIANDPDADRCAVAVPDPAADGGWRMLRGDDVGALLATHLVHKRAHGTFATTIVSSSLLSRIAHSADLPYEETLTGFKWLGRVEGLRYAYEEALGYCVDPEGVCDKDGVTAALLVAELAAELKQADRSLTDLLDDLAVEHGLHATDQLSVRVADLSRIASAMERLRSAPPVSLAGLAVVSAEDLSEGSDRLPPTDGLRYQLAGDPKAGVEKARVVVRPSGTEPKLKCYLEVVVPVRDQAALAKARGDAESLLAALKGDLGAAAGL